MKENGAWLFENNHFGENDLTNDINIDRVLPKLDFRHLIRVLSIVHLIRVLSIVPAKKKSRNVNDTLWFCPRSEIGVVCLGIIDKTQMD